MSETECESCGNTVGVDSIESFCFGCKKMICQTCVDVWGHIGGGSHGLGDPVAKIARLREELGDLKAWVGFVRNHPSIESSVACYKADEAIRANQAARSGEES